MSVEESNRGLEKTETHKDLNIAGKFRTYRLLAESTKTKLKEAETVIEELKTEINFSRIAEKNLRTQITSTQDRLIFLQETVKKFVNISDQQHQNEKISQRIQERIKEFEEEIDSIRRKSKNVLECATREVDLQQKINQLESVLGKTNNECDLLKMEIQTLTKEKTNMETEFQEKIKNLENSLEELERKERETQIQYRETLLYYKHQMEDYEQKIERYEQERKSFLEDFEPPRGSEDKITMADSTVSINPDKRAPKRNKTQTESLECDSKIFCCSPVVKPRGSTSRKSQNYAKKQKPQLEFLTQDSSARVTPEGGGRKRRLFSANCNHYFDFFDDVN